MRTLVISDLHLGQRGRRDVLRERPARERLLAAVADVDRLVLLGDLIELRQGPWRDALAAADPVLRELAASLGERAEVVLVPGNHDHWLLSGWLARRESAPPLALAADVDWREGEPPSAIAAALGAPRLRVSYPGVWLREDVYATHGHYADRHTTIPMFERLGAGVMARLVSQDGGPTRAEDYEEVLAPLYAWIHAVAQSGGLRLTSGSEGPSSRAWGTLSKPTGRRDWRRRALIAGFPLLVALLNRAGLGPLRADISGPELRRAFLRAMGEVCVRLGVEAPWVLFGHTHRAGPLPGDDPVEWRTPSGGRLLNTGCWVHEPRFVGSRPHTSPYRAGFAARLEAAGPPQLLGLLDEAATRAPVPA